MTGQGGQPARDTGRPLVRLPTTMTTPAVFADVQSPHLRALRNRIRLRRAPFSDRGSRILVWPSRKSNSAFDIKIAQRMTDIEPGVLDHLSRPPFICGLRLIDEMGAPLDVEVITYPHALFLETRLGTFGLTFQDEATLSLGVPPGVRAGVRLVVTAALPHTYDDGGDVRTVRNFSYATNASIVRQSISGDTDGHCVEVIIEGEDSPTIALSIRAEQSHRRDVVPFCEALAAAEARWHAWFDAAPAVDERFREQALYAWWIMGSNLVSPLGHLKYEAMMPSKSLYIGIWQWDAYFHALAYRWVDPALARDQIRVMLAQQLDNGMIPDAIYDEGIVTEWPFPVPAPVTKPPLAGWAALKLHEMHPDLAFLAEIYPQLVRNNNWWFGMNDDDADGIVQYNHPHSSGADDNPLWDGGMPVESPDINTYLCMQQQALAEMADLLGRSEEAAMWRRRAQALGDRMVEHFYDEEAGVFWATRGGEPIRTLTIFNLYPLITGLLSDEINERLIAHLTDPAEFWPRYPIPTVAMNDVQYAPLTMWRGPTWINTNYLFIEGLRRIGRDDLADELRDRTLDLVMANDEIYEYYHPMRAEGPPLAAPIFGWSAALFLDLAIQARAGRG